MDQLSIWPLVAAAAAAVGLGYLWYHPRLFGTFWLRLEGITPEMAERGSKHRHFFAVLGFLSFLLVAYVMRMLMLGLGVYDIAGAALLGLWIFAGFAVPILLGSVLWEHKSLSLYCINIGYWLCALVLIAGILAV